MLRVVNGTNVVFRFFSLAFNSNGIRGTALSLLAAFTFNLYLINKFFSVRIDRPSIEINEERSDLVLLKDEEMPDKNFKIYKNNVSSSVVFEPGHSFGYVLYKLAMPNYQVEPLILELKKNINFSKISPGTKIDLNYDCRIEYFPVNKNEKTTEGQVGPRHMYRNDICLLKTLKMNLENDKRVFVRAQERNFSIDVSDIKISRKVKVVEGKIENSLFQDAVKNGAPAAVIQYVISQYSFDVDFQRDIHVGDTFLFMFDEVLDESGNKLRNGEIKHAVLRLGKKDHSIYRFEGEFFSDLGESIKRAMLRTPVDGARISSKFSNGRKHPILGYTRKHQGVDFAAPIGTPIYAASDGVVELVTTMSGYGNFVTIKHNSEFKTNYAHLSRYAAGLKKGMKVKQRQVIGYVGMTGLATGPHLHFEVVKNGKKIDPSSQKFASHKKLSGAKKAAFDSLKSNINQQLRDYRNK